MLRITYSFILLMYILGVFHILICKNPLPLIFDKKMKKKNPFSSLCSALTDPYCNPAGLLSPLLNPI